MTNLKEYLLLFFKGVGMGAAEVIPGISSGSVAFVTGIYEEILYSFHAVDRDAIRMLFSFRVAEFWKKINGNFLITLLAGAIAGLFTLARLALYLVERHPILIRSFFFGLLLILTPLILRKLREWTPVTIASFVVGIAVAYLITVISPITTPDNHIFVFIAGFLAISAIFLPGISLPFILVLLGKYQFMIGYLLQFNLTVIGIFLLGCLAGLILYSRFLTWILQNYRNATVALLAGLMLGSLNKNWPWRQVLEYVTDQEGKQVPAYDKSILPWNYLEVTGKDPQVFQAIMLMALGVFIVVLIEKIAERLKTKI